MHQDKERCFQQTNQLLKIMYISTFMHLYGKYIELRYI